MFGSAGMFFTREVSSLPNNVAMGITPEARDELKAPGTFRFEKFLVHLMAGNAPGGTTTRTLERTEDRAVTRCIEHRNEAHTVI